jgi:hypothetical protein
MYVRTCGWAGSKLMMGPSTDDRRLSSPRVERNKAWRVPSAPAVTFTYMLAGMAVSV